MFWRRIEKLCPTWDGRELTSVGGHDDRARSGGAVRTNPALRLNRNLVFEERAGLRPPIDAPAQLALVRLEPAIHLAGTHPQQRRLGGRRQPQPSPRPRDPRRQKRLEPYRPRIACRVPDGLQRGDTAVAYADAAIGEGERIVVLVNTDFDATEALELRLTQR